jgi:hypothetical protein
MSGYTPEQLAELKANLARGVAEISKGDERVKFRSLDEMRRIINDVEADVNGPRTRQHYPTFSKGI